MFFLQVLTQKLEYSVFYNLINNFMIIEKNLFYLGFNNKIIILNIIYIKLNLFYQYE
jgi:hypothetical protein